VVPYVKDATHSAVERVALSFAPRARERLTFVEPPLLRVEPDDEPDRVQQRIAAVQGGWGDLGDVRRAELAEDVADLGTIDQRPQQDGRNMTMLPSPVKKGPEQAAAAEAG
jgi:hypothetical protein